MLRTTLSTLKKACLSLSFAPRLIRGDTRYSLGKFHKLSIIVLRKAEKSTKSGKETKEEECERCKKLIELIFGPSIPPDVFEGIQKPELPDADVQHIVYSEPCVKQNAPVDVQLHATTAKQTEEQLAQKIESINETPLVDTEKPVIDGFNTSPKVLGSAADTYSTHKSDILKQDYEDRVENNRLEENLKLENVCSLEEVRRVEQLLSKEFVRSEHKLPINTFAADRQNRKSGASADSNYPYDELAKRCLDAPNSKIDERLLKEMKQLGVPQSSPRGENSVIEENIIQIDVLKKPRKPARKTEIDLEAREFERDPPIAYVSKLHPAFQMANAPKAISDDDIDSTTLKSERIQLYELDKKPLTYSENSPRACDAVESDSHEDSRNVEPRPDYDPNIAIIDPYDKRTLAYENCEEEYDPYWYQKYSVPLKPMQEYFRYPHTSDAESEEARNNAAIQLLAANCSSQTGPITTSDTSIDQAKEQAEPYITFETHPLDHASDRWQFSEQPQPISDTKTIPEEPTSETSQLPKTVTPEATLTKHANETIQLSIQIIDPILPERTSRDNTNEPSYDKYQYFTSSKPTTPLDANISKAYFVHYTPDQNKPNTPKHPNDTSQLVCRPEPIATPESVSMRNVGESFLSYSHKGTIPSDTDKFPTENFQYSTPAEPTKKTIHYSNPPESVNKSLKYMSPSEPAKVTIQYLNPSETDKEKVQSTYNTFASEHANETLQYSISKPAKESFQYSSPPKPAQEVYQYSTPREPVKESFQYSTPPDPTPSGSIEKADVTYIEQTVTEKPKVKEAAEQRNRGITPEQTPHSFQPQAMVNPLVDRRTLSEPADDMQKTMSSACGPIPKVKLTEELSLSEMLKRVRMRNRMEYCQAYDRQMEPVTGKCGKKTPPCPPPAPKCPQNPPPSCPPSPPPCPKPCKPACPPPCPPPCPPKNPCQKFKNFPGIDLKKLIALLLQPDTQKSDSKIYVRVSERSRDVLAEEMSVKLQEIGLNLLMASPRKIVVSGPSEYTSAQNLMFAKDYEPWVPIPSWPIPKKEKKRPFVCPKDGCKLIPPPKLRPACNENPCVQFPKRTNSFSIANLLSFTIGEHVEFDILD